MVLLFFLYLFASYYDLAGMEALDLNKSNCCNQTLHTIHNLPSCCYQTMQQYFDKGAPREKRIFRFSFTNNCIKEFGKRYDKTHKLSSTGRQRLNCDPSLWQMYFKGIAETGFEIILDKDCIADASITQHDPKTCLSAYPSPKNFQDLLAANYFLFPDDSINDLSSVFSLLDSYEKYLFINQKLHLRRTMLENFDEMITNYEENKSACSRNVKTFLDSIKNTTTLQNKNNMFFYNLLGYTCYGSLYGSLIITFVYLAGNRLKIDGLLVLIASPFLIAHADQLIKDMNLSYRNLHEILENIEKKYKK